MAAVPPLCMIPIMTDTILAEENARLKARLAETEAALADAVEAQKRLESIVSELRREKFGRKITKLYAIEKTVRGSAPEARLAARRELSAPIIEGLPPLA